MASPVPDSYSCASGGVISGGRYRISGNQRIDIWGQSNALGRALRSDISAAPLSSDGGLSAFDSGTFDRVYIWSGSSYQPLSAALNQCTTGQFGPEFGIAVRWMRETSGINLYLHKEAGSGVSITTFAPAAWPYTDYRNRKNAGTAWLTANGLSANDAGWLWVQGESDAGQTQSWYETRLTALISGRSDDGLQTASTKRLLVQMLATSSAYGDGVKLAKASIAAASAANTLAKDMPAYLQADNMHLNGRGQVQLGYDAFEYFFNATQKMA